MLWETRTRISRLYCAWHTRREHSRNIGLCSTLVGWHRWVGVVALTRGPVLRTTGVGIVTVGIASHCGRN